MNQENELLTLFKAKREEIGTAQLADALGVKNTSTIRMICAGSYPNPEHVLRKFAQLYVNVVHCPYIDREIGRDDCNNRSQGPRPFGGQAKLAWWAACQSCNERRGGN